MTPWLEVRTPFFRPMWRRVAAFTVAAGWTAIEAAAGSPFWIILSGAAAAYLGWAFFIAFDARAGDRHADRDDG